MSRRLVWIILGLLIGMSPIPVLQAQDNPAEVAFWESVRESKDPAEIETYLKAYPDGTFAPIARIRLEKLRSAAGAKERSATGPPVITENKSPKIKKDSGWLGIQIKDVENLPGAEFVAARGSDSPAAGAGLETGDVIQKVDGKVNKTSRELALKILGVPPGKEIQLTVRRNGQPQQIAITVGSYAKNLLRNAKSGDPKYMMLLGKYLSEGKVFEKDLALAAVWYRKARDVWKERAAKKKPAVGDSQ